MDRQRSKFTRNIIGIILLGTIVPLIFALTISTIHSHKVLLEENISLQQSRLNYTTQYIDNQFSAINNSLLALSKQDTIKNAYHHFGNGKEAGREIESALADFCYIYPNYANIYLCSVSHQQVYSAYPETGGVVTYKQLEETPWYENAKIMYNYTITVYPFSSTQGIACMLPQRNPVTLAYEGYCMVKIKASFFDSAFSSFDNDGTPVYCLTSDGNVIAEYSPLDDIDLSGVVSLMSGSRGDGYAEFGKYIVCWRVIQNSDLTIVSFIPNSMWLEQLAMPNMFSILLAALCVFAGLLASLSYLRHFLMPINRLALVMQSADLNNLTPIPLSNRRDEISVLEQCYNKMVANFNHLLQQEYKASLAAQEAQINALQFQINPHFVNNTLQMIGTIAVEHGMMEIYELLQSFSSMFYYCLKYKGRMVTIQDELDYLQNYMRLQEKRFPGKILVEQSVDKNTLTFEIPKMILQPIVENCFSHAFREIEGQWKLGIILKEVDGCCMIHIYDNGKGLSQERLACLLRDIYTSEGDADSSSNSGIALRNVNTRLRLLYGDDHQLHIESAIGVGTTITLSIPNQRKESPGNDRFVNC